jgi:ribonucleoside-diphosphate reductase beta chain
MPLDLASFPMHLFRASQERGWVAAAIDLSNERAHWASLADDERELLSRLIAGFRVGERGVTHELAPLQQVLREEKRLDEELYVTAQMFEEARHVEFFERWLDAALPGVWGKDLPYPQLTGDLFSTRLPEVMRALLVDPSPAAQVRAVVTYHFNIEGIGAESAYPIYFEVFAKTGLFPAMREGISLIRRDEARHIAFGIYLLNRLINESVEAAAAFERELALLEPYIEAGASQTFAPFAGRPAPFGLEEAKFRGLYRENFELMKRAVYERRLAADMLPSMSSASHDVGAEDGARRAS